MAKLTGKRVVQLAHNRLSPLLEGMGFRTAGLLRFFRVSDHFVHVLVVSHGRDPGKLYVAYFVNLLADPRGKLLKSWTVGARPGKNQRTGRLWIAHSDTELDEVLVDIYGYIEQEVEEFFLSMTLDRFLAHLRDEGTMFNIQECIALIIKGDTTPIGELCRQDIEKQESMGDLLSDDHRERVKTFANTILARAHSLESLRALVDSWRIENLAILERAPQSV